MGFKILTNDVKSENVPVIKASTSKVFSCQNFKGELSSVTGINSRFLYIPKIELISGEVKTPDITILCGLECKENCINLFKKK